MAWDLNKLHFNNLTTQLGRTAWLGLTAHVNPNDVHAHKPTKHVYFQGRNNDGSGDGHIHEFWSDRSDGHWNHNDLTNNASAPPAGEVPSSYMFKADRTKHVIYQGADEGSDNGRINELWWDGDWHHNDLTSAASNAPLMIKGSTIGPFGYEYSFFDTISQRNVISQRVVYRTNDNKVHQLLWDPLGWGHTAVRNVPDCLNPPTAYAFTVHGQEVPSQASQRVLYFSLDDFLKDIWHVREVTWNEVGPNNREWVPEDLTVSIGAPLAEGVPGVVQPLGLMHDLEFTLHVFYSGKDGHLYELVWNDSGWHVNDLTVIVGAAGGLPLAYVHLGQGTLNVIYVGADGIHVIWREVGKGWNPANQQNLTMPSGAPPAMAQPVGFVFRDLTQHVFYIADNSPISDRGDIIELTDE